MEDVKSALNRSVYCATINRMDFNIPNKEVVFDLTLNDDNKVTNHELRFINCSSFLWIESMKENDSYDYRNWDYYEITDINIRRINVSSEDKWLQQYPTEYNIAIEIWETVLLIKATELIIDQQHFLIDFKEDKYKAEYVFHCSHLNNGFTNEDVQKHNLAMEKLSELYHQVKKEQDKSFLLELMQNDDCQVRLTVAAHCLGMNIYLKEAKRVIRKIRRKKRGTELSFEAEMILKVWKERGYLEF